MAAQIEPRCGVCGSRERFLHPDEPHGYLCTVCRADAAADAARERIWPVRVLRWLWRCVTTW
jgi:hypothetical protein